MSSASLLIEPVPCMQEGARKVAAPLMRCLWIAREMPFPMNTGDRIYTARLAKALADAGVHVTFLALEARDRRDTPVAWPVQWHPVKGRKRSYWRAVLSCSPLVTAAHRTPSFQKALPQLLGQTWDAIVLDHYGTGWVLDAVKSRDEAATTVVVHIAQNHEETLSFDLYASYRGNLAKRVYLFQNYLKTRRIERHLTRKVDLVTAITLEDRDVFQRHAPDTRYVILTPGYSGWVAPARLITPRTPRHVILVGSYRWVVKHENLRLLLRAADARFAAAGIVLDVIGDVPKEIQQEFLPTLKATRFHGFVDDVAAHLNHARIALVPEVVGGGFKLKFLDYIFGRVPIASISAAAAGLPKPVRQHLILAPDLDALVSAVIENIDQTERLQKMQEAALASADVLFDWRDRGVALRREIERLCLIRKGLAA